MAEEMRQLAFLALALVFGAFGGLVNYAWLKQQKKTKMTKQGTAKAVLVGAGAALLVWVQSSGGDLVYHVVFIVLAFMAGLGAEAALGKAIGSIQASRAAKTLQEPREGPKEAIPAPKEEPAKADEPKPDKPKEDGVAVPK